MQTVAMGVFKSSFSSFQQITCENDMYMAVSVLQINAFNLLSLLRKIVLGCQHLIHAIMLNVMDPYSRHVT